MISSCTLTFFDFGFFFFFLDFFASAPVAVPFSSASSPDDSGDGGSTGFSSVVAVMICVSVVRCEIRADRSPLEVAELMSEMFEMRRPRIFRPLVHCMTGNFAPARGRYLMTAASFALLLYMFSI